MSLPSGAAPVDANRQSFLHFAGEGPVHRNVLTEGRDLVSNFAGLNTVHELGQYVFLRFYALYLVPHPFEMVICYIVYIKSM